MKKCPSKECPYFEMYGKCAPVCLKKGYTKILTNFDRIKNMSVDELATFICGIYDNDEDLGKFINGTLIPGYNENDIKEWLEREVEQPC
jgi:hypothetical protein